MARDSEAMSTNNEQEGRGTERQLYTQVFRCEKCGDIVEPDQWNAHLRLRHPEVLGVFPDV